MFSLLCEESEHIIIITNEGGLRKMKKAKELLVIMMVCIILCGVNAGIETCGHDGKDYMGVLSYSKNVNEY